MRHQQRQPCAHPTDLAIHGIGWHQRNLWWQNDRPNQNNEQNIFARESEARKAIRHQRRRYHGSESTNNADQKGVQKQPAKSNRAPGFTVVIPFWAKAPHSLERAPTPLPLDL